MRILQVVNSTEPRGAETAARDLGLSLEHRGHDARTVALSAWSGVGGLDFPVLGKRAVSARGLARLVREMRRASVTIAYGSRALPACAAASVVARRRFVYRGIGDPRFWAATRGRRLRVRAYLARAEAAVVLWPAAAQVVRDRYRLPAERVFVIPGGVFAAQFLPATAEDRASARKEFGLPNDRPVVVVLGALSPEKNVTSAIRALQLVPEACLLVAGDGPERDALEQLAAERVAGRARFVGVTDPVVALAASDVLLLPSQTEGMPGVVIEAAFCGVPAVATDVGAIRELIVPDESGAIVAPGDDAALGSALQFVLARHAVLGRRAREHCLRRFESADVARQWEAVLDRLAPGAAPPGREVKRARRRRG